MTASRDKEREGKVAGKRSKGKNRRRGGTQQSLVEAVSKFLPGQWFSQWPVVRHLCWTPQRLFWMGLLICWGSEQTLGDRFDAARTWLASMFPRWSLGTTYTGWYDAQLKWLPHLQPAVARRLRAQIELMAGSHWTREGWCAFAVDGSRVECPRTRANQD